MQAILTARTAPDSLTVVLGLDAGGDEWDDIAKALAEVVILDDLEEPESLALLGQAKSYFWSAVLRSWTDLPRH